jgi:hypothetical protein
VAQAAAGAKLLELTRLYGVERRRPTRDRRSGLQDGGAAPGKCHVGRLAQVRTVLIARVSAPPST